jgi:hypothetical protein
MPEWLYVALHDEHAAAHKNVVLFGVGRSSRSDLRSKRRRTMRTIFILASAALISAAAFAGPAAAEENLHLTPPLYRDQALVAQQGRRLAHLTTTPQLVPATGDLRIASTTKRTLVQASAEARR